MKTIGWRNIKNAPANLRDKDAVESGILSVEMVSFPSGPQYEVRGFCYEFYDWPTFLSDLYQAWVIQSSTPTSFVNGELLVPSMNIIYYVKTI